MANGTLVPPRLIVKTFLGGMQAVIYICLFFAAADVRKSYFFFLPSFSMAAIRYTSEAVPSIVGSLVL